MGRENSFRGRQLRSAVREVCGALGAGVGLAGPREVGHVAEGHTAPAMSLRQQSRYTCETRWGRRTRSGTVWQFSVANRTASVVVHILP